jgi:hypothetical protein
MIYLGEVSITATVVRGKEDKSMIQARISLQSCDGKKCLVPGKLTLKVE